VKKDVEITLGSTLLEVALGVYEEALDPPDSRSIHMGWCSGPPPAYPDRNHKQELKQKSL
jgi:hypothetical protein